MFVALLIIFGLVEGSKAIECGKQLLKPGREGRIVGGNYAYFGEYPWHVLVALDFRFICGGTLLNNRWAVTATHCFLNDTKIIPLSKFALGIGEYDYTQRTEPLDSLYIAIFRRFLHPEYDANIPSKGYDITLMTFKEIKFFPHIQPLCLPAFNEDENLIGKRAILTGWGRIYDNESLSPVLKEVPLPIINNTICEKIFSRKKDIYLEFADILLCAGYANGKQNGCTRDSGGPLQMKREDGSWFLIGITSFGDPDCNGPMLFTRVTKFIPWIRRVMQANKNLDTEIEIIEKIFPGIDLTKPKLQE